MAVLVYILKWGQTFWYYTNVIQWNRHLFHPMLYNGIKTVKLCNEITVSWNIWSSGSLKEGHSIWNFFKEQMFWGGKQQCEGYI